MHQFSEKESARTAKMALNQILIHNQNSKKKSVSEFSYTQHFSKKIVARFFLDAL
jgi:hypothetical protein